MCLSESIYLINVNVAVVMNVPPSPNGSINSGNLSSEDSSTSSTIFGLSSSHHSPPTPTQYPLLVRSTASSSHSFGSLHNKSIKHCRVCGDRAKSYHVSYHLQLIHKYIKLTSLLHFNFNHVQFGGISCDR